MKIVFTKHAIYKLQQKSARNLQINKEKIKKVLENPIAIDKSITPHRRTGKLTDELSLCVIYKVEKGVYKVITFYPAEKGRYESKVLRGR